MRCWIYPEHVQAELAPTQDTPMHDRQTADNGQIIGLHVESGDSDVSINDSRLTQ